MALALDEQMMQLALVFKESVFKNATLTQQFLFYLHNGQRQFVHLNVVHIRKGNSSTLKMNYFSLIKQNFLGCNSHYAWPDIFRDEYTVTLIINLTHA